MTVTTTVRVIGASVWHSVSLVEGALLPKCAKHL
jgi:hypothetical protein